MLIAHLRGLLKSTYSSGAQSIAREIMVLDALELERAVELRLEKMHLDCAFSTFYDPKKIKEVMREMGNNFEKLSKLALFDLTTKVMPQAKGSIEDITKIFYALGSAGLVTMPESAPEHNG
jgi:hypothetical protein